MPLNSTRPYPEAGNRHDLEEKHGSPITTHSRLTRAIREAGRVATEPLDSPTALR